MQVAGLASGVVAAVMEADGTTALLIRPPRRAAPPGRILRAATPVRSAPMGYLRSAPVGYSAHCLRASYRRSACAAPLRRLVCVSNSPSFLGPAPTSHDTNRCRASPHLPARASKDANNAPAEKTPQESDPKGPTSFWDLVLGALQSDIFKLSLLGISLLIGGAAMKGHTMAGDAVDVCDKAHKVYNIVSKALPLILAFFKG